MKKKKAAITALTAASALACAFGIAACDNPSASEPTQIEQIYAQYTIHAQAEGQEPLSYEKWLELIKGEKGDQGKKGDQGEKGDKGDTGCDDQEYCF